MFCHKCGSKSIEGSAFCQKCGAKLIVDESASQTLTGSVPTIEQKPATTTSASTIQVLEEPNTTEQKYQQAPTADASLPTKAGRGLRNIATVGRVLMGISLLLLFLGSFFSLSINPIIIVGGVAIGTILSALGLKRPLGTTKIIELVVAFILLVAAIAYAVSSSGGGIRGSDKYVQMVKGGTLDGYPQKTVGRAFDDFLSNPKWESGLAEDGQRFVNVKGGALYFDEDAELLVQFIVDDKNETFQYNACEIDGVPQNNFVFWGLLETIYNDDSALPTSASQDNSNALSSGDRIVIGETQSYDVDGIGNMEVTLDYVEFIDRIENAWVGGYAFPDEGNVFLRAALTVKNIGTGSGQLLTAWNTVIYDGVYEFRHHSIEGDSIDIKPLTPPTTEAIIFEVPNIVAESDGSLVLNINDGSGEAVISYVIRPDATSGGSASSMTETDTYYVQRDESMSDEYLPTIILHSDGTFTFNVNLLYGLGQASGTYDQFGNQYTLYIMESDFGNYDTFAMEVDGDGLIYRGEDWIGATGPGAVFYRTDGSSAGTANSNLGSVVMYSSQSYPFVSAVPDFLAFVTDGNTITSESNTEITNVNMITISFRHHYDWNENERLEYFDLLKESGLVLSFSRDGLYEWQYGEMVIEMYFDEPGTVNITVMDWSIEDGPG